MASALRKPHHAWPALSPIGEWQDTFETVHLWSQIVGKVRLELSAPLNHSWGTALYVTPRGLTTSAIPYGGGCFQLEFDFVDHIVVAEDSKGRRRSFSLHGKSVADFYHRLMAELDAIDIEVDLYPWPVELPDPIQRLDEDEDHASYDGSAVRSFWEALIQSDRVMNGFRSRFVGKSSPVHFFWGAFDLAVTRFSGRKAPRHPGGIPNTPDRVMVEAYSHEVHSVGFWPGSGLGEAAFYAYAYPEPEGFRNALDGSGDAYFSEDFNEYILPYEAVRSASDPDAVLTDFLQQTYEAAADLGKWDRDALERQPPR